MLKHIIFDLGTIHLHNARAGCAGRRLRRRVIGHRKYARGELGEKRRWSARVSRPHEHVKPDFDLGTYLPYYLAHILHCYDSNMAADLARHGLNNSSWRVISTLDFRDGLTIKELSQYTVLERSFVSRIVAKLEERGFVSRHILKEDRRNVIVHLSAEGRHVLQNVMLPVVTEHLALALKGVGTGEETLLIETLAKILDNVYRAARSTPPDLGSR